jgi:hypothetical protein
MLELVRNVVSRASEILASALVDRFTGGHLGGQAFNEYAGRVL